jgi:hypothetical protein
LRFASTVGGGSADAPRSPRSASDAADATDARST